MSRKIKQLISALLMVCMMGVMLPGMSMTSFAAASARISFSDPTVTVGEEVKVTMKFATTDGTLLGDTSTMLAYDSTALEYVNETANVDGGAGSIRVRSQPNGSTEAVTVLRFKALQAGTTKITIISWDGYNNDGQTLNVEREGTSTITISPLATSSTDASLRTMRISPGTLSPAFTPLTESYSVTVGLDTDKLAVSADTNNSGAKVVVEGGTDFQEGENTVVCKVTAEDGVTTKNYTITVNKIAGGETAAATEGEPEEAEETEVAEVAEEVLATLDVSAKQIQILSLEDGVEIPKGFKESTISVGTINVQGWVWSADEKPGYCVFYGMNEAGEKDFYRYDLTERTIQRYFEDPVANAQDTEELYVQLAEDYNSLLQDFRIRLYILIAVAAVAAILLILVIVSMATRKKAVRGSAYREEEPEEELKTYIPVSAKDRKVSKEEQYMLGEEDDYIEYDELDMEPEDAEIYEAEAAASLDHAEKELKFRLAEEASGEDADQDEDDDFEIFNL